LITGTLLERGDDGCVYTGATSAESLRYQGISFVDVHVIA